MRLRNKLLVAFAVFAVAVAAGLFWLNASLDSLVEAAIKRYGPQITQVSVDVAGVKLAPADGKGAIHGLQLGNPKGFKTGHALRVGEISLAIDPASLARDVIVIREMVIRSPDITYETGAAGNNLETIQKNIEHYVASLGRGRKDDAGAQKKLIIENLRILDGKVNFNTALTVGKTVSSGIPDLHLKDIGKKSSGASAGEVSRQVWDALLRSAGNAASRIGSKVKERGKSLIEGARNLFK